jgi:hypothetical protein
MQAMNANILQHIPDNPDNTKHYLFYLHGLIVEEAGQKRKLCESENFANMNMPSFSHNTSALIMLKTTRRTA